MSELIEKIILEAKVLNNINDNFRKWFGNSKIVENGAPIVTYHQNINGDNTFSEFRPQSFGSFGENSMFYFAKDKNWVKNFIKRFDKSQLSQKPRRFYLSIQNPLNLKGMMLSPQEWLGFLEEKGLLTDTIKKKLLNTPENAYGGKNKLFAWILFRYDTGEFRKALISKGYDGIIQDDSNYGRSNDVTTYVALYPNQIKSVNNDGTWDSDDNNINS